MLTIALALLCLVKLYQNNIIFSEIKCHYLTSPYNGKIVGGSRDTYSVHTAIEFSCNDGYSLSGLASITCQEDGSWSGNIPSCEGNSPKCWFF